MYHAFIYVFVFLTLLVSETLAADLGIIQSGASIGDKAVVSGRGSVSYSFVRVDSLGARAKTEDDAFKTGLSENESGVIQNIVDIDYTFAFDGIKMACHEQSKVLSPSGKWYNRDWHWAYDGEKMELYRLDPIGENGLLIPLGSIRTENKMQRHINDPRYDSMMIHGTNVSDFLNGEMDKHSVESIQTGVTEVIDNMVCDVITGRDQINNNTITIWMASEVMFRPLRIEISSPNERMIIRNTFRDYGNGIWFPQETLRELYYQEENSDQEQLYARETITIHKDFEVNVAIPSDTFELEFPVGMTVYDFRSGEFYDIVEE